MFSALKRQQEMSAMVSALTHVVAGEVRSPQAEERGGVAHDSGSGGGGSPSRVEGRSSDEELSESALSKVCRAYNNSSEEDEDEDELLSSTSILPLQGCWDDYSSVDEFKKDLNEAELLSQEFDGGVVLWRRSVTWTEPNDNIITFLKEFASSENDDFDYLVQFWAREEVVDDEGRRPLCLTTSSQPFALLGENSLKKGYCWYMRKQKSREHHHHHVVLDDGEANNAVNVVGPIGRAFRNGQPESSPDLRLYSTAEHPLRDHAARCGLRTYIALPLFHRSPMNQDQCCLGVLELVSLYRGGIQFCQLEKLDRALQAADLRSSHNDFGPIHEMIQGPLLQIKNMLRLAYNTIPELLGGFVWVPCKECPNARHNLSFCWEMATTDFNLSNAHKNGAKLQRLQMGKGIAGRAMASKNKACYCRNSCDLGITDYPLVHYAVKEVLNACFAICLQSSDDNADISLYLFEFFLCQASSFVHLTSFLRSLLPIMKKELQSFTVALSGQPLGSEELVIDLLQLSNIDNGDRGLSLTTYDSTAGQSDKFPFRFEIIPYDCSQVMTAEPQHHQFQAHDDLTTTKGMTISEICLVTNKASYMEEEAHVVIACGTNSAKAQTEEISNTTATTEQPGDAPQLMEGELDHVHVVDQQTHITKNGIYINSAANHVTQVEENNINTTIEQETAAEKMKKVKDLEKQCENPSIMAEEERLCEMKPQHVGDHRARLRDEGVSKKKSKRGRGEGSFNISYEDLEKQFGNPIEIAAKNLCVSRSTLKHMRDHYGLSRWPSNEDYKNNLSLCKKAKAKQSIHEAPQENIFISNQQPPSSSLPQNYVPQTNVNNTQNYVPLSNANETQNGPGMPINHNDGVKMVRVKATFESSTCKILLSTSSTLEKLREEITRRYTSLRRGNYMVEYLDEDSCWILLACDDDWHLCVTDLTASGNAMIQIRVLSIDK